MVGAASVARERERLLETLFPQGVPRLWCPPVTHFSRARRPDMERIRAHWQVLSHDVGGLIVPGTAGEGWDMRADEVVRLIERSLPVAHELGLPIIVGVLKNRSDSMLSMIGQLVATFGAPGDAGNPIRALAACPPLGGELRQDRVREELERVFSTELPVLLCQFPEGAGNAVTPPLLADLASRYPHLIGFQDSRGDDAVAGSGLDFGGMFLLRGAESDFARCLREGGGPYDGLLLSSANAFSADLASVLEELGAGRGDAAQEKAKQIESAMAEMLEAVADFPGSNRFTLAAKALDQVRAYGSPGWRRAPAPCLVHGSELPVEFIEVAEKVLRECGDSLSDGYLGR